MSNKHNGGNIANSITQEEHRSVNGVDAKAVIPLLFDGTNLLPYSTGLINGVNYDYIGATYPNTSTEVYTYKLGGSGGTTNATITVVYSDATTKQIVSSVTRT